MDISQAAVDQYQEVVIFHLQIGLALGRDLLIGFEQQLCCPGIVGIMQLDEPFPADNPRFENGVGVEAKQAAGFFQVGGCFVHTPVIDTGSGVVYIGFRLYPGIPDLIYQSYGLLEVLFGQVVAIRLVFQQGPVDVVVRGKGGRVAFAEDSIFLLQKAAGAFYVCKHIE